MGEEMERKLRELAAKANLEAPLTAVQEAYALGRADAQAAPAADSQLVSAIQTAQTEASKRWTEVQIPEGSEAPLGPSADVAGDLSNKRGDWAGTTVRRLIEADVIEESDAEAVFAAVSAAVSFGMVLAYEDQAAPAADAAETALRVWRETSDHPAYGSGPILMRDKDDPNCFCVAIWSGERWEYWSSGEPIEEGDLYGLWMPIPPIAANPAPAPPPSVGDARAEALREALEGGTAFPDLSRIGWLSALLAEDFEQHINWESVEDPEAWHTAIRESRDLVRLSREALAAAAGDGGE